jgi:hypothetical protein
MHEATADLRGEPETDAIGFAVVLALVHRCVGLFGVAADRVGDRVVLVALRARRESGDL